MKCSGNCDPDVKPYYCDKSCQRAHWKEHKPFCTPGMDRHSNPPLQPPRTATIVDDEENEIETVPMPRTNEERELATRRIEIVGKDGKVTVVESSTMTAAGLKALKAGVEKKKRQRRKGPIET